MSSTSSVSGSSSGVDLSISGLASGFDWKSVVTQLANAERAPEYNWQQTQATIASKNAAFDRIKTFLSTLQTDVQSLKDPNLFGSRTATPSDTTIASASATANATTGTYSFNITQLATAAQINGTGNIAKTLNPTSDLSTLTVANANLATPISSGTLTVNGKQITIAGTDTLQQVFANIATATNNNVTGSYDPVADKFTLTSADGSAIVLGSATDTSNFFQAAGLYNNQTGTITSTAPLGDVNTSNTIYDATAQLAAPVASGLATAVNAGTFTVNGKTVTIRATDTLSTVFSNIATATNNAVTASYNAETDKITLTSVDPSVPVTLGAAGDTSNFLTAANLSSSSSATATSSTAVGGTQAHTTNTGLVTPITDGGSGQGAFTINGVTINYDAGNDSIQNILDRINNSAAGVNASYDTQNNRFLIANKVTGDVGIAMQDRTGNFLAATGLAGGTLAHGKNLLYTLNGNSQQLVSQTNTITSASSNINGLTVNVLNTTAANTPLTVTVGSDTTSIKNAIQKFVTDYNSVQSYIGTQTASSTDSTGKVTAGILAADPDANAIVTALRNISFTPASALTNSINQLASLGISTNGKDNTITLSDSGTLDSALSNNLNQVQSLFTDSTNGIATQLDKYFTSTIGDNGTLTNHMTALTAQSSSIDTQIANLEKTITTDSAQWTAGFQAMETAQSKINSEMTYLTQSINNGSL